jgi:hypothetical protein
MVIRQWGWRQRNRNGRHDVATGVEALDRNKFERTTVEHLAAFDSPDRCDIRER